MSVNASADVGHWVTIEGRHIFIGVPEPEPESRRQAEEGIQVLKDHIGHLLRTGNGGPEVIVTDEGAKMAAEFAQHFSDLPPKIQAMYQNQGGHFVDSVFFGGLTDAPGPGTIAQQDPSIHQIAFYASQIGGVDYWESQGTKFLGPYSGQDLFVKSAVHEMGHAAAEELRPSLSGAKSLDGRNWSTPQEAFMASFYGPMPDSTIRNPRMGFQTDYKFWGIKDLGHPPTPYGRSNVFEDFAESWASTITNPVGFRRASPQRYAFMKDLYDGYKDTPMKEVFHPVESETRPLPNGLQLRPAQVDLHGLDPAMVRIVPVDRLVSRQQRMDAVPEKIAFQRKALRGGGTLKPLRVADQGPDYYRRWLVLDGNHRLFAAQDEGLDVLPVVAMTEIMDDQRDQPPTPTQEADAADGHWVTLADGRHIMIDGPQIQVNGRDVQVKAIPPEAMRGSEINAELDRLDKHASTLTDEFIAAGRGNETATETRLKNDPLARAAQAVWDRQNALHDEIRTRYGPSAPSRLPSGAGTKPRIPVREAASDSCDWVTIDGRHICINGQGKDTGQRRPDTPDYSDRDGDADARWMMDSQGHVVFSSAQVTPSMSGSHMVVASRLHNAGLISVPEVNGAYKNGNERFDALDRVLSRGTIEHGRVVSYYDEPKEKLDRVQQQWDELHGTGTQEAREADGYWEQRRHFAEEGEQPEGITEAEDAAGDGRWVTINGNHILIGGKSQGKDAVGPRGNQEIRDVANLYAQDHGLSKVTTEPPSKLDPAEGRRIADAYDAAKSDASNPETQKAYAEFGKQLDAQAAYLRQAGFNAEPWTKPGQPYANSQEMRDDVRNNHHLYYFQTSQSGSSPPNALMPPDRNDEFRWVHDAFGHSQGGHDFGPNGEYNAFREHSRMFYGDAIKALATETLAQSAWFNFSQHNAGRTSLRDRDYADQKATLLPQNVWGPHIGAPGNLQHSGESEAREADVVAGHWVTLDGRHVFIGGEESGKGKSRAQIDAAWSHPSPEAFIAARDKTSRPGFLAPLVPSDLTGKELYVSADGKVGFVLADGDAENLFNNGGPKGAGTKAVFDSVQLGGRTLDAFDGYLPKLYTQAGFVETGRMKFNPDLAPPKWNTARDDSPDVVFMAWKGWPDGTRMASEARALDHEQWKPYTPGTRYVTDYDAAKGESRDVAKWQPVRESEIRERSGAVATVPRRDRTNVDARGAGVSGVVGTDIGSIADGPGETDSRRAGEDDGEPLVLVYGDRIVPLREGTYVVASEGARRVRRIVNASNHGRNPGYRTKWGRQVETEIGIAQESLEKLVRRLGLALGQKNAVPSDTDASTFAREYARQAAEILSKYGERVYRIGLAQAASEDPRRNGKKVHESDVLVASWLPAAERLFETRTQARRVSAALVDGQRVHEAKMPNLPSLRQMSGATASAVHDAVMQNWYLSHRQSLEANADKIVLAFRSGTLNAAQIIALAQAQALAQGLGLWTVGQAGFVHGLAIPPVKRLPPGTAGVASVAPDEQEVMMLSGAFGDEQTQQPSTSQQREQPQHQEPTKDEGIRGTPPPPPLYEQGDVPIDYNAVGDENTCDACLEAEAGSPYTPDTCPLPGEVCFGGDSCRCYLTIGG